ncbi:MAG: viroplasmin family protein [Bacteroides fragilis]|nr:viroplasmin family protein [Bacteroides fragilis]
MENKKYYAVRIGKKAGIYQTWAECETQTKGVSGAQYKLFGSFLEAEKYISGAEDDANTKKSATESEDSVEKINSQVEEELKNLKADEVIAFVDGSYNSSEEKSGFGVIIIDNKGVQTQLYKAFTKQLNPGFLEHKNIAAELEGVKEAVNWAITYNKTRIKIYYDYEGIGKWADGSWKASKDITKRYVSFIKEKKNFVAIEFCKVPAHSAIGYNEQADKLAKNSLLEKGYKTYNDGSIYFVGFSGDDWKAIIDCINEENTNLTDNNQEKINIDVNELGNRQRMVITDSKNKVVINCYTSCNFYVQGKQSVLFQKIISMAIELMTTGQTVIETLNRVHVLTLSKEEIEVKFEELLPHYSGKRSEKHYNNLLSTVYNTMLVGYMPDYTSLITPIFRAYEYFLHRILGDKMGLNTCDSNGKNNFSFFNKNTSGRYECNSAKKSKLTGDQLLYLDDLYNAYNKIRHPYSHWSADDYDTAVITEMEVAQDYLGKGLTLADKYYRLF